jgi:hypothetical protein
MTSLRKTHRSVFFHAINIANPANHPRIARQDFWGATILSCVTPIVAKLVQAFLN